MRFAPLTIAAAVSLSVMLVSGVEARTVGTASGIHQGVASASAIEKVVRVCRHRFWTSKRECYVDRSRPPTVCHHLRATSGRDCY